MPLGAARFGLSGADLGKLELIQTQTFTTTLNVDFTSIDESTYNVHFATISSYPLRSDPRNSMNHHSSEKQ